MFELEAVLWDVFVHQSFHESRDAAVQESGRWLNCCCVIWDRGYTPKAPIWWVRVEKASPELRQPILAYEAWLAEAACPRPVIGQPPPESQRTVAVLRSMAHTQDQLASIPPVGPHTVETPMWRIQYLDGKETSRELWNPKTEQWEGSR
jgi:hypothetical protein